MRRRLRVPHVGAGAATACVPIYVAEIAPKEARGGADEQLFLDHMVLVVVVLLVFELSTKIIAMFTAGQGGQQMQTRTRLLRF